MQGPHPHLGRNLRPAWAGMALAVFISISVALTPCPAMSDAGRKARGGGVVCDVVDRIEVNHFLNAFGETTLDQVIFWGYSTGLECYVVRDWRSLKSKSQLPVKCGTGYRAVWWDTRDQCMRSVWAGSFVETFTDFDPETTNQEICDRNFRVPLTAPVVRKAVAK